MFGFRDRAPARLRSGIGAFRRIARGTGKRA